MLKIAQIAFTECKWGQIQISAQASLSAKTFSLASAPVKLKLRRSVGGNRGVHFRSEIIHDRGERESRRSVL